MKTDMQLNAEAIRLRQRLGEDPYSPMDIFRLISSNENMTIAFFPMGERISGISIQTDDVMLMGINSTQSQGRQRFTAAHELYHLFYDDEFSLKVCYTDMKPRSDKEREADTFASFLLAPYEALLGFIEDKLGKANAPLTIEDVIRIEQHFGLSRQTTLVRLQKEGYLTAQETEKMKTSIVVTAKKLGYNAALYKPTPEEEQYTTYGRYVALVEELNKRTLISSGIYEELLLDAFRSDIVYGSNLEDMVYD